MHVTVLGAGLIGVASAWYLRQQGFEVTVLESAAGPALGTSFANGGQLSVSYAEPWANPRMLWKALKWLGKEDAPLLYRLRLDPDLWRWSLRFLWQAQSRLCHRNMGHIIALSLSSRAALQQLRASTPIEYDHARSGILHLYTEPSEFAWAQRQMAVMQGYGCERRALSAQECLQYEPALQGLSSALLGGILTPGDDSGDAHQFTVNLSRLCAAAGVRFEFGQNIERLVLAQGRVVAVETRKADQARQSWPVDHVVVALGCGSARLLRPLGLWLPVYPAKGYSATLDLENPEHAPSMSLTDDKHKLVFSRLGDRLRVAGTAEFSGYDESLNLVRCEALLKRTQALFPALRWRPDPHFWAGLRPATPNNVPLIGRTRWPNVYLNTGHGTLGWTMACGSGLALAQLVAGQKPEIVFPFLQGC